MSAAKLSPKTLGIAAILIGVLACAGIFIYLRFGADRQPAAKQDERTTVKEAKGVRFKRPEEAKLRGIEAQAVTTSEWRPKLHVDGRVVPNPHATLDLRAPFAGIVRIDSAESKFRLGTSVAPHETLAMFDARFTPTEGLDLKTKLVEAEARHKSAEEVVKIRQESWERRNTLPAGLLTQDDVDSASVQLLDARMQANIAFTQWKIWKQALESVGKKTVIVPIQSPIDGEITDIGVQPGTSVDAGQMIVRIIDFRRVLLRLDFPTAATGEKPPSSVHVRAIDSSIAWRASLRGRAPNLEPGLQKASWFYEIMPDEKGASPSWQVGFFATAALDDLTKNAVAAIKIPRSSILVHQGRTLVYIEKRLGRYERREVEILGRDDRYAFVAAEGWLPAADRVVTSGAQVLLSEEFRNEQDED